jgi:hypothetical protein
VLPGLVQQQLQQLAASSRIGAALVILQWLLLVAERIRQTTAAAAAADAAAAMAASSVALAAEIACCVPEQLPDGCLVYLGAPGPSLPSLPATEPYTELAASYSHMRRELYRLMNLCLEVSCMPARGCVPYLLPYCVGFALIICAVSDRHANHTVMYSHACKPEHDLPGVLC